MATLRLSMTLLDLVLLMLADAEVALAQQHVPYYASRAAMVTRRLESNTSEGYNFMFYFVIGAMMLTCLIYNIFFKHKMEANFLRQNALPETMLRQDVIASDQEMNHLWECEVCSFKSYEAHQTCMLCGTDRYKQLKSMEEGADSGGISTKGKYVLYVDESAKATQKTAPAASKSSSKISREFFKRKLSGLNLRQQSARRRHEWTRQRNDDGEYVWVRKKNYLDRKALKSLRSLSSSSLRESICSTGSTNSVGVVSRIVVSPKNPTGRIELDAPHGAPANRASESSRFSQEELEQVNVLPFQQKHAWFVQHTAAMEVPWEYGHLLLEIDRENLLHNSCEQLLWATPEQLHQSLRIKFANEPGVDAGGLVREWFTLMTKEVFDDTTGLFYTSGNGDALMINPASAEASVDHLMYYQAIGRFIGRALFEGILIDAHLALPLCKHILGIPITFSDLEFVDHDLHKNLKWLRDNRGVESLALDFTVTVDQHSDKSKIVELIPNGANISVTEDNKMEYINLRFKWIVANSVSNQLASLVQGLFAVIPRELLSVFDHQELELLICGIPDIDVVDWKTHTIYVGERDEQLTAWFWNIVEEFTNEQKARLLQFTTGSARVPVQGFKALTMNDGRICPFAIQFADCAFPGDPNGVISTSPTHALLFLRLSVHAMKQHAAQAAQVWQPAKYLKFETFRLRPALELLGRVPSLPSQRGNEPIQIADLGAGSGNMGPAFLQRWPNASVTFVDTSASMLEQGKAEHASNPDIDAAAHFSYVQDSFETYQPTSPVDLIYSNAALHWVSTERQANLLPRLLSYLKPGGVLAFQIPDTRAQPSHQLMVEAAAQLGITDLVANVRWVTCERDPDFYYELFKSVDAQIGLDMWATIYAQVMEGENPVADFTSSTGLGPYLEQLGGRDQTPIAKQYEQKYRELIAKAYPKQKDGRTIFNLKRFFVIATKPL
ncbi:Hect e3 ubiquitin ligase, partial [Globisporangium splendens]